MIFGEGPHNNPVPALSPHVQAYNMHGLTGAALHQAILRQTAAVQRSYAAAAAAATVAGVVDE